MPPKKYARRKRTYGRKKRTFKRTKYYKKRRLNSRPVGTTLSGIPAQRLVKMRYVRTIVLSSVAGASAQYTFRWNSIWDPDYTGVGNSDIGYDMWGKMYGRYTVMAAKLNTHWSFYNSDGVPSYYGLFNQKDPASLSVDADFLDSQGMGKIRMVQPYAYAGNDRNLGLYWRAKKWFNLKDVKDNQDRVGANFGANPGSDGDAYVVLYLKAGTTAPNVGQANAFVKCTFTHYVLLSDPIPLAL